LLGFSHNPREVFGVRTAAEVLVTAAPRQTKASLKIVPRALPFAFSLLLLLIPLGIRAQSGNTTQSIFAVEGGQNPLIVTFRVDQTTGALTTTPGVTPASMRALPYPVPSAVNPAGTLLFVPSQNSSSFSAVSVFSISSTGALTELAASPFSASDSTVPLSLAVSLDGQYLYAASAPDTAAPLAATLNVYSIGADGTLTPVGNYPLPQLAGFLYLHPTGRWLYVYGRGDTVTSSIEWFTIGPSGALTDNGNYLLPQFSDPSQALVGDNSGKYLFALHGQFSGPAAMIDTLLVNGASGALSLVSTYSSQPQPFNPEYEAVDSTGAFLFSTFANLSETNGVLALLQSNFPDFQFPAPLLLASRTSPFLFVAGRGQGQTQAGGYWLESNLIGSDGSLTPAPGSPYTLPPGITSFAVTGSLPAPTEPVFSLLPNAVTFASISPGQTTASPVTVSSTGFSPLAINNIFVSGDASFLQTNNCPPSLVAGATCTVNLKWAPPQQARSRAP
jgi:6-phosphogluconolactonase (cycloisomerase 2 family)